ncbi:MAG: 50S ribosomal protein L11 methyltransferase [Vicinamibacterales bacterium]
MLYPALDVHGADPDLVLALVDDFAPTAVEDVTDGVSIFFATAARRDEAGAAVARALPDARLSVRDVDDEDWAKRSQENLTPVTVGRITVTPPWFADVSQAHAGLAVTILPSMGFGTGHHATTRLCLAALQSLEVEGRCVLDVGTGSGVLAMAAALLGAREALGIDFDPDAVANARENLELNPSLTGVRFETVDVRDAALPSADIVLANLTGGVLVQNATLLRSAVAPGGTLIVSGLQSHERTDVLAAFAGATVRRQDDELDWVALTFTF